MTSTVHNLYPLSDEQIEARRLDMEAEFPDRALEIKVSILAALLEKAGAPIALCPVRYNGSVRYAICDQTTGRALLTTPAEQFDELATLAEGLTIAAHRARCEREQHAHPN